MQQDRRFPGPVMVIAGYKPKEGKEAELKALVRGHVERLRQVGLATDRPPVAMRAADGTILEVFEWASQEAIARAHEHPEVQKMWGEFDALCTFASLRDLPETASPFPNFEPVS
jgi:hypothetical protein